MRGRSRLSALALLLLVLLAVAWPASAAPEGTLLLHQIQRIVADQTLAAPIFQQAFIWGVGPRVAEAGASLIEGYPYAAPCEDLKLK